MYTDDALPLAQADSAGRAAVFSLINTNIAAPYTIQSMASVQRALGHTMAAEIGYIRNDGNDFTLQRQFTQAFDRQTGLRPTPPLGELGDYSVDMSLSSHE